MKNREDAMKEADEARQKVEELVKKNEDLKETVRVGANALAEMARVQKGHEKQIDYLAKELDTATKELAKARENPILKALVDLIDERVAYWRKELGGVPGGNGGEATLEAGEKVVKVKDPAREVEFTVDDVQGKLLKLAADGHFDDWKRLGETKDALEAHKWVEPESSIRSGLEALEEKRLLSVKSDKKWGRLYAKPDLVRFVEAKAE
jgi:hypothetical protein